MLTHELSVRELQKGPKFQRLRADPEAFELVLRVARRRRTSLTALLKPSRGRDRDADARKLAMYLVHVVLGRPQEAVAEIFGRDRTTVAHACRQLEDEREDALLDAEITRLEKRRTRRAGAGPMEFKHAA